MGRYSPSPVPTTDLDNTQRWLREEMEQVRGSTDDTYTLAEKVVENFVASAYGSIGREADLSLGTLGATWTPLVWEQANINPPKGLQYDLPDGFILTSTGIWQQNILLNIGFDEAQQGRTLQIRFYDTTNDAASNPIEYYVGRNTEGITITMGILARIDTSGAVISMNQIQADTGIRLEIRSEADTFTTTVWKQGAWDFAHQSELQFSLLASIESIDRTRGK